MFLLCLTRGLERGWTRAFVSGLGIATADGLYCAVAAFGVAAVTGVLARDQRWLAAAGGVGLVALGARALARRASPPAAPDASTAGLGAAYLSALGLTI